MNKTFKKHLVSACLTFISVFALAITAVPDIQLLGREAWIALAISAVRAGLKAVAELLPTWVTE